MTTLPPIYAITLRQTPERTRLAAQHFAERGLQARFFYGVHGPTWGLKATIPYSDGACISQGHVGLVLSHWMLWQLLLDANVEEAIILEDDARFPVDFQARFFEMRKNLPGDWQFVYVGNVGTEVKPKTTVGTGLIRVGDCPFGTHCYLVRRSALSVLIETNQQARANIDIQIHENSLPKLNWMMCWPSLASQDSYDGKCPRTV